MNIQRRNDERNDLQAGQPEDFLLHSRRGPVVVREHPGLRGPINHGVRTNGGIQAEAGWSSGAWEASSSDGYRSGLRLLAASAVAASFAAYCVFMAVTA